MVRPLELPAQELRAYQVILIGQRSVHIRIVMVQLYRPGRRSLFEIDRGHLEAHRLQSRFGRSVIVVSAAVVAEPGHVRRSQARRVKQHEILPRERVFGHIEGYQRLLTDAVSHAVLQISGMVSVDRYERQRRPDIRGFEDRVLDSHQFAAMIPRILEIDGLLSRSGRHINIADAAVRVRFDLQAVPARIGRLQIPGRNYASQREIGGRNIVGNVERKRFRIASADAGRHPHRVERKLLA